MDDLYTAPRHEKGAEMQVNDEFGKKIDLWIMLAGVDSKLYRNATNVLRREALSGNQDEEALKAKAMADITLSWRGRDGFSKEAAEKLYLNAPYIYQQADEFIIDRLNFMKG